MHRACHPRGRLSFNAKGSEGRGRKQGQEWTERDMDEPSVELTVEVWPKRVHGLGRFWGLIACTRYVTRKIQSVHSVVCSSDIRG